MFVSEDDIHAEIYTKTEKGVYYAKVHIPTLQLWINSITARPSIKYPGSDLWVQMPAFKYGNRWIKPLEFRNDSQLKILIIDEVKRAVDRYNVEAIFPDAEVVEVTKPP